MGHSTLSASKDSNFKSAKKKVYLQIPILSVKNNVKENKSTQYLLP